MNWCSMKAEEREHVRHAALVDAIRHAKERDAAFANPSDTNSFRALERLLSF